MTAFQIAAMIYACCGVLIVHITIDAGIDAILEDAPQTETWELFVVAMMIALTWPVIFRMGKVK